MTVTCPRWLYQLFCYTDNGCTWPNLCTNCNVSPGEHGTPAGTIRAKVAAARFHKAPWGRSPL